MPPNARSSWAPQAIVFSLWWWPPPWWRWLSDWVIHRVHRRPQKSSRPGKTILVRGCQARSLAGDGFYRPGSAGAARRWRASLRHRTADRAGHPLWPRPPAAIGADRGLDPGRPQAVHHSDQVAAAKDCSLFCSRWEHSRVAALSHSRGRRRGPTGSSRNRLRGAGRRHGSSTRSSPRPPSASSKSPPSSGDTCWALWPPTSGPWACSLGRISRVASTLFSV